MAANKTVPTTVTPEAFIARVEHPRRRSDALVLLQMMREETGVEAIMWGPSIVGFGVHHYVYDSGREGDSPCVGFSPRTASLVLYGLTSAPTAAPLLEGLGRFRTGAACLYVNTLDDVDVSVLRALTRIGYGHMSNTSKGFVDRAGSAG